MTQYTGKYGIYFAVNGALTKAEREANAEYIRKSKTAFGWSLSAICGFLGNTEQESGVNPGRWQGGVVKDSKGYGLVQATPSTNFLSWAKANGQDELMDGQLAWIEYQRNNGKQFYKTSAYPLTFKQYAVSAESPYYLARVFGRNYERSSAILAGGEAAEKSLNARGEAATAWHEFFAKEPAETVPNSGAVEVGSVAIQPIMDKVLDAMRSKVGKKYSTKPNGETTFDCAKLAQLGAKQAGYSIEDGATSIWEDGFSQNYWAKSGTIDTLPANESAYLFNRGITTRGTIGMRHVAGYDGRKKSVVQAGGFNGTGVHENPFSQCKSHFTHWAILREKAPVQPPQPQEAAYPTLRMETPIVVREAVKTLQNLLNQHGARLTVDGKFGAKTDEAVREFQDNNHLEEDGIVGVATWTKLTE
jgi:hypothetical protein